AGELSADDPEDFNGAQAWNQEAELAGVGCRGRLPSHIRAGTGPALDESFSLKVPQRPPHSRSRDLKSFDELRLTRKTTVRAIFPRSDLSQQLPGNLAVFGFEAHRSQSVSNRLQIGCASFSSICHAEHSHNRPARLKW